VIRSQHERSDMREKYRISRSLPSGAHSRDPLAHPGYACSTSEGGSKTHQLRPETAMGFAALYPSYGLPCANASLLSQAMTGLLFSGGSIQTCSPVAHILTTRNARLGPDCSSSRHSAITSIRSRPADVTK
jgi:hypothetical protein